MTLHDATDTALIGELRAKAEQLTEELEKWQKSIVANLFGWKRFDALGRVCRRYRECLLYVPRKNAKAEQLAEELEKWQRRAEVALHLAESNGKALDELRRSTEADAVQANVALEARSSSFWHAQWKERNRERAETTLRIAALEREAEELRCGDRSKFFDGELDEARAQKFRDHLGHCRGCAGDLGLLMQTEAIMSAPEGS